MLLNLFLFFSTSIKHSAEEKTIIVANFLLIFFTLFLFTEEMGDYDPEIHVGNYVSDLKLALRQTDILERKVMDLHKKREPNQDVQIAVDEFLAIARNLETYGIDPHPVKDHRGTQIYLGINSTGISTFASGKRVQHFRWPEVHKLNYEGKMFIAHLSYTDRESREPVNSIYYVYKYHHDSRYINLYKYFIVRDSNLEYSFHFPYEYLMFSCKRVRPVNFCKYNIYTDCSMLYVIRN